MFPSRPRLWAIQPLTLCLRRLGTAQRELVKVDTKKNSKPTISSETALATGCSALSLSKAGWGVAKHVGLRARKFAMQGGSAVRECAADRFSKLEPRHADYTNQNFYDKGAATLENLVDALLNENQGTSTRIVRALAVKLAGAGTTTGIFSIASILGTASTGTAISSLSGAAFNSAALAWIGGSVAAGGWIVLGAAGTSSAIAFFGARAVHKKWFGQRRQKNELDPQERQFIETCLMLATAFRKRSGQNAILDPITAQSLNQQLREDLFEQLDNCIAKVAHWPKRPRWRLEEKKIDLVALFDALSSFDNKNKKSEEKPALGNAIFTGVVSATLLKLMSGSQATFSESEELVLQALRRSKTSLCNATEDQLSGYVQSLSIEQISGLKNNVKGIYHELAFQQQENLDGDEYFVELFHETNHEGADIRIINALTGEVSDVQLKATNYAAYVREHNEKYESIEVLTTSEIADMSPDWVSSGFSNTELADETATVLRKLANGCSAEVIDSMGVAAMVTLAVNARSLLLGNTCTHVSKAKIIQNGVTAASVAGLMHLVV